MQRMTYPSACVLQALASGDTYGFSIMSSTGLPSGTVYQILRRFERQGLVRSSWEEIGRGRPRRRYYALTRAGEAALSLAAERYRDHARLFERQAST